MSRSRPQAAIIAGPNGSGKSTAATELLPEGMVFVNADLIAQEVAGRTGLPGDINAGRLMVQKLIELEKDLADFAIETTLATRMLGTRVAQWQAVGYQVHIIYFYLPSPDLSVARVEGRVRDGGHHVPEETIRRRYDAGLKLLFNTYMPIVDTWRIFDNSSVNEPEMIARGEGSDTISVMNEELWNHIVREYGP